jgi:hypothetical protein
MTTGRNFLQLSLCALAATSIAVALPQSARGETFQIRARTIKTAVARDLQAFLAS